MPDALAGLADVLVLANEWLDVVPCQIAQVDDAGVLRVVLVDGPPAAIGRVGFLDFFLVFWKTPAAGRCRAVVFDDTDRPAELELAARFADLTGWALERHVDGTKAFTVAKRPH